MALPLQKAVQKYQFFTKQQNIFYLQFSNNRHTAEYLQITRTDLFIFTFLLSLFIFLCIFVDWLARQIQPFPLHISQEQNYQNLTTMNLQINIKEGLGDIKFDMPIEQVVSLIGEADEVETIDNAVDETTTVLHYENGLTLFFEGNCPTLSCIDISNEDCTLFGEQVFNMDEKAIVNLMVSHQYFEQDVDNEDWGERRVSFNEGNIDFFLEENVLMSIIIGK